MSDPTPADAQGDAQAAPAPAATLLTDPATPNAAPDATAADKATADAAADQQPPADKAETPDAKAEEADKPAEKAAPEKYEFTAPEGANLDDVLLGEFEAVARELDLSQEEAQTVVNKLAPKLAERVAQQMADQQAQAIARAAEEWTAASTADKEIGGEKLAENLGLARKALDAFGTPELRTLLEGSRLGNHPEVIRFMVRAGRQISEDRFVPASSAPPKVSRDLASALYPTSH